MSTQNKQLNFLQQTAAMVICRLSSTLMLFVLIFLSILLSAPTSLVQAWGIDGHRIICNIAEQMLNPIALAAVEGLLPDRVDGSLSNLCSWADDIRHTSGYSGWSAPLHYIYTPDKSCTYDPKRDCHDATGKRSFCASGAIWNYTDQLEFGKQGYNLTESLLFLSHIVGDIHQPLHAGFEGDSGGSSIKVYWYNKGTNLHRVWDTLILLEDENKFFDGDVGALTTAIYKNITTVWSKEAAQWNVCAHGRIYCPELYASESIWLACRWAYKDAASGTSLSDPYFLSRLPVMHKRLGQAGVRLARILNTVFPYVES